MSELELSQLDRSIGTIRMLIALCDKEENPVRYNAYLDVLGMLNAQKESMVSKSIPINRIIYAGYDIPAYNGTRKVYNSVIEIEERIALLNGLIADEQMRMGDALFYSTAKTGSEEYRKIYTESTELTISIKSEISVLNYVKKIMLADVKLIGSV